MTSIPVTVILFKRPPMPFTVMMARFLSPVLSAQFMTPILTLILNLTSSWSSSCPSPCLQLAMLFLPAVGPLFSLARGSCWCCCELLFVLVCRDLCPLPVLTHVFIAATFSHVLYQNFPNEAAHHTPSLRLRLAEPPHALSRAARGLGVTSPTLRKTHLPPGTVRGDK